MYLNGNPQTTTSAPLLLKVQARVLFFLQFLPSVNFSPRIFTYLLLVEKRIARHLRFQPRLSATHERSRPSSRRSSRGTGSRRGWDFRANARSRLGRITSPSVADEEVYEGEEEDRSVAFCVQAMRTRTCSEWH